MKTNKTIMYLCLVAISVIWASCSKQELLQPDAVTCGADYSSHPDNSEYQVALDQYVSTSVAPGSVIGVKKYQETEWIGAYGINNLEFKTDFEVCTQFRCGSVTKMFTAVIVMQLYDEGELSLESTVAELLPEIKDEIPESETMTVTQLLNHSSGLKHPTDDDINYQLTLVNRPDYIGSLDHKERLEEYIYGKPLKNSPGTNSYYSNAGYWVLQLIIEKITGKSLQQNLEERIIFPLELDNTYLEKRDDRNVSRGYNFSGNKMKDVTIWDSADNDGDPAAGIISNAHDLLIFGEALLKVDLSARLRWT